MASESCNLRTKVNMLVQKGQMPEPSVRFTFLETLEWHCQVDLVLSGVPKHSDAVAPTKAQAHENALAAFDLPALRAPKSAVPKGCWMLTVKDDIEILYTSPDGNIKTETVKNTSNIFAIMQRVAKSD